MDVLSGRDKRTFDTIQCVTMTTGRRRQPRDAWAHAELDNVIAKARRDGTWSSESTALVTDPDCRQELIARTSDHIWPGIQRLFAGTELVPNPTLENGQLEITQKWASETSMSFLILVSSNEDTGLRFGDDPYFCRLTVNMRPSAYIIENDFYLYFPASFDMDRLKALLANPRFSGNPPKLVYETGHDDNPDTLIVEFHFGRGYEHPLGTPTETMLADFAEHVNFLRRLIRAVRTLSTDCYNEQYFQQVVHELEKCFPAR